MLTIRNAQMKTLREAQFEALANRACGHLRRALPEAVAVFGEEAVKLSAQTAVSKCRLYRVDLEYDVLRYFNLMYVLGFDFDTNPSYPWAADILRNGKLSGKTKLDLLNLEAQRLLGGR